MGRRILFVNRSFYQNQVSQLITFREMNPLIYGRMFSLKLNRDF